MSTRPTHPSASRDLGALEKATEESQPETLSTMNESFFRDCGVSMSSALSEPPWLAFLSYAIDCFLCLFLLLSRYVASVLYALSSTTPSRQQHHDAHGPKTYNSLDLILNVEFSLAESHLLFSDSLVSPLPHATGCADEYAIRLRKSLPWLPA